MKKIAGFLFIVTFITNACISVPPEAIALPAGMSTVNTLPSPKTEEAQQSPITLSSSTTWQIQYTGEIDYSLNVSMYNVDLFGIEVSAINQMHERGIFVMCYFSAGSFEDWRPDITRFPAEILGKDYEGWLGEKWLDIRKIDLLAPIMSARLDLAAQKGCDGVDPDNVHGFANDTGFPLTYEDQLKYNIWLAKSAHERGLLIGLKNDLEQIPDLVSYFDWQLNEECFQYDECEMLLPFIEAGKPVFNIEYTLAISDFCPQSKKMGFNSIRKNLILDAPLEACK